LGALRTLAALLSLTLSLIAAPAAANPLPQGVPAAPTPPKTFSAEDLEELVGPIALYPDVLLANVLAASVFPDDLVAAQAMKQRGGDPVENGDERWDDSVRFVASFPDVLSMLAAYPDWTAALGEAYLVQPGDTLDAIQSLRAIAWDNGALRTNQQQVVVQEGPTIVIEPASPQRIYVPVYQPSVVFVRQPVAPVVIGFGVGIAVGAIWSNNVHCNWGGRCVSWGPGWWGRTNVNVNVNRNVNRNVNIGGGNNTNINVPGRRPGTDGSAWRPDSSRPSVGRPGGPRVPDRNRIPGGGGVGGGSGGGSGWSGGASRPQLPSQRPSIDRPGGTARPSAPVARPPSQLPSRPGGGSSVQRPGGGNRPGGGSVSRPSGPSRPTGGAASRPSGVSRPSGGAASRPSGGAAARPTAPAAPRSSGFRPSGGGAGGRGSAARGSGR